MKPQLGACHRAVSHRSSEAVFITDDVLAAAFARFARKHVRYQSHVPGPLEAQKRAARRKNTVLAHVSRGPILDPSILYANKSQSGWWNSEPAQEHSPAKSVLPAWLLGPAEATAEISCMRNESAQDFEGDLTCCESPSELRTLVRNYELNLRLDTAEADAIYDHVTSKGWSARQTAEYLAEPVLNPPGCGNHLRYMRKFHEDVGKAEVEASKELEDWSVVLQGMCKSVRLGLLSAAEWMHAVDCALAICGRVAGCETYRNTEGLSTLSSASVVLTMLESLKQCPVINRQEISLEWLEGLPRRALGRGFNSRVVRLLKVTGMKRDASLIVELLTTSMQRAESQTRTELLSTADALSGLTRGTMLKVLGQTTAALTRGVAEGRLPATSLSSWMKVLRTLNGEVNGEAKYRVRLDAHEVHLLTNTLRSGPSHTTPESAALVLWTVHQLYDPTARSSDIEPPDCLSVVRRLVHSEGPQTVHDLHHALINAVSSLPLPDKETFIARLPALLNRYTGYSKSDFQATFAKLLAGDLAQITHTATYCYMKKNHGEALAAAVGRVNADLPAFRRLCCKTISSNKVLFKVVTRIIRHNTAFQHALRQSWAATDTGFRSAGNGYRPSDESSASSEQTVEHVQPKGDVDRVNPAEALDTMHYLAVLFATSRAAPSRTALGKVYFIYKILKRCRAPVLAPISRALWYAGFERDHNKQHCGTARLRWLLGKVKEIEGPEVAWTLVRSPEFRKRRREGLEKVAAALGDGSAGQVGSDWETGAVGPYDDDYGVLKEYEQLEKGVAEVMQTEEQERLRRHEAFEALPEQPSMEEFERWLAGKAESLEMEEEAGEAENEDESDPIWSWERESMAGGEGEARTARAGGVDDTAAMVSWRSVACSAPPPPSPPRVDMVTACGQGKHAEAATVQPRRLVQPSSGFFDKAYDPVCIWDNPEAPAATGVEDSTQRSAAVGVSDDHTAGPHEFRPLSVGHGKSGEKRGKFFQGWVSL